jgi:hypothetical protein
MTEIMRQDFSVLNETNRKKIVDMTRFLVLTQNSIIPDFLGENGLADTSIRSQEERRETP